MNDYVQHLWNCRRAEGLFHPVPIFRSDGIRWGAGTVLAHMRGTPGGAPALDLDYDHDRAIALVAAVTGRVQPGLIRHFERAAVQWQAGNEVGAQIQLAFARIPRLGSWDDVWRLFLAEECLLDGLRPGSLLKELGFARTEIALLKYPGQPRVPAGNGRASGEYGSGGQGNDARVTPVFFREPDEVPSKHDPDKPLPEEQADQKPGPHPVPGIKNPGPGFVTDGMVPAPFRTAPEIRGPATGAKQPPGSSMPPAGQTGDVTGPAPKPGNSGSGSRGGRPPWAPDPNFRDDEPQRCPAPVKDVNHYSTPDAQDYEDRGHAAVNPDNPLLPGQAILYHNIHFDDCAQNDDPQGGGRLATSSNSRRIIRISPANHGGSRAESPDFSGKLKIAIPPSRVRGGERYI